MQLSCYATVLICYVMQAYASRPCNDEPCSDDDDEEDMADVLADLLQP